MPDVGEGLTEAEILKWYVAVGDTVTDGQVVCEVETAKAAVELPIPFDGVVSEHPLRRGGRRSTSAPRSSRWTPSPGAGDARRPAGRGRPARPPRPPPSRRPPAKRQAVLVGYGVATASAKRRPRKPDRPGSGGARPGRRRHDPGPSRTAWPLRRPPPAKSASAGEAAGAQAGQGPRRRPDRRRPDRPGRRRHPRGRARGGGPGRSADRRRRRSSSSAARPWPSAAGEFHVKHACRSRASARRPRRRWWPARSPRRTSRSS